MQSPPRFAVRHLSRGLLVLALGVSSLFAARTLPVGGRFSCDLLRYYRALGNDAAVGSPIERLLFSVLLASADSSESCPM